MDMLPQNFAISPTDHLKKTIDYLEELRSAEGKLTVDWLNEPALAVDAIRGSVMEQPGWIETLDVYFRDNPVRPMIDRALDRLRVAVEPCWEIYDYIDIGLLGLGTYGWKYNLEIMRNAIDGGIGLIDTAEGYGYGRVEKALGDVFSAYQEDQRPMIASKVSRNHLSYQSVRNACARSVERMHVPFIDLYQVHRPNTKFPIVDTMRAMSELVDMGSVVNIGIGNCSIDQLWAAQCALHHNNAHSNIVTVQVRYNMLDRGIERALLPLCQDLGIVVIAYSPLGQDFKKFISADVNGVLRNVAQENNATPAQVALSWLMSVEGVVPIPRTNNLDHLVEILESPDLLLSAEDLELLDNEFPVKE